MKVVVLTGAGISAESGIPTFRSADGLWEGHRLEDVATPIAFQQNPELVHQFYNARRRHLLQAHILPNAAHIALADYEATHDDDFLLITQNVDNLHFVAGSQNILPMHGQLMEARCTETNKVIPWCEDLTPHTPDPETPSRRGRLRPNVVWFGETPYGMEEIQRAAQNADLFLAVGTSAVVYPAAGIVEQTPSYCRRVEINLDATPQSKVFTETIRGPASIEVPEFLQRLQTEENKQTRSD
ncbi:MAG: NAD-dependent protein deacylase [Rhodopirellula sp.]|nr:NAD-dependent protein deacylase [Rhodopirellula sp.]OUX51702.1 MAG: NAD-dependent protein deacylase [Rhodopirellula sp. TMED283]